MNTDTGNLARALRNPLVVFGLVLLLGDGPLVIAYLLAKDPTHSALALVSLILFVFMIAAVFCYLALFRPRHLYAPDQIPESAYGKNIYLDPKIKQQLKEEEKRAEEEADRGAQEIVADIKKKFSTLASVGKKATDSAPSLAQESLEESLDKAVSLVRGIERERLRTVEVSRAKRIILDYLQHRPKEVSPAEILRRTAVDSPFSPGTFEFALKALVAKGHVEVLSPSRYRLSPKIGRVAETEWRGDSWYVRLEGSEDWIREDELEPVDDSAPECE